MSKRTSLTNNAKTVNLSRILTDDRERLRGFKTLFKTSLRTLKPSPLPQLFLKEISDS
jgi:hypothetical protein